jgi:trehalose 6-phosphate phosphatase
MAEPLRSIAPLMRVIRERPLGVMSDIDGTLSPIVERPGEATVPEAVREALRALLAKGVRVGLISGRMLEMARRMVGLDEAAYATEHGLRLWLDGQEEEAPGLAQYEALARKAEEELLELPEEAAGVEIENKGPLLAVHYRRAANRTAARAAILSAIGDSEAAANFRTHEGRMVIELRPPLAVDKGTALETLAERLGLRGIVCLGDDVTDIDMFEAAARLGGRAVATVAVRSAEARAVEEAAEYSVAGVAEVEWLLREIARALP